MPKYISGKAFFTTPFDTAIVREDLLSQDESRQVAALHHVLAFMTTGKDMSSVFNEVAPLTSSSSVRLKRLSYLYMIHNSKFFAEKAVLQAGTFVKDTLHDSALMRGAALRTMTSLQLSVMADFINAPLRRAVKDESPYVRHTAVIGILKQYVTSPTITLHAGLLEELHGMLYDTNAMVVSGVIGVMQELQRRHCPVQFTHVVMRSRQHLVELLPDASEWSLHGLIQGIAWSMECSVLSLTREQEHIQKHFLVDHTERSSNNIESDQFKRLRSKWELFVSEGKVIALELLKYLMLDNIAVMLASVKAIGVYMLTVRYLSTVLLQWESRQKKDEKTINYLQQENEELQEEEKKIKWQLPQTHRSSLEDTEHTENNNNNNKIIEEQHDNAPSINNGELLTSSTCQEIWTLFVEPMVNTLILLTNAPRYEVQFVGYKLIEKCVVEHYTPLRKYFVNYLDEFIICHDEPIYVKLSKLAVLINLCDEVSGLHVLSELMVYITDTNDELVRRSVNALGELAVRLPSLTKECVQHLVKLILSHEPRIVEQCIIVAQRIVQHFPGQFEGVIPVLCGAVHVLSSVEPRVAIIWMLGEYTEHIPHAIDDFLDFLVDDFATSPWPVQLALLTTMMKVYIKKREEHDALLLPKAKETEEEEENENEKENKRASDEEFDKIEQMLESVLLSAEKSSNPDVQSRSTFYNRLLQHYSVSFVKDVIFFNERENKPQLTLISVKNINHVVDDNINDTLKSSLQNETNNNTVLPAKEHIVNLSDVSSAQVNMFQKRQDLLNDTVTNAQEKVDVAIKDSALEHKQMKSLKISNQFDFTDAMQMLHEIDTVQALLTSQAGNIACDKNNFNTIDNKSESIHTNAGNAANNTTENSNFNVEWQSAFASTNSSSTASEESEEESSEEELELEEEEEEQWSEQEIEEKEEKSATSTLAPMIDQELINKNKERSHKSKRSNHDKTSPKTLDLVKSERNTAQSKIKRSIMPYSHAGETNIDSVNMNTNDKMYMVVIEPQNANGLEVAMSWSQLETNLILKCRFRLTESTNKEKQEYSNKELASGSKHEIDYVQEVKINNVQVNRNMFGLGIAEIFRTIHLRRNDEAVEVNLIINCNNITRPASEIEVAFAMEPIGVRYAIAPAIPPILIMMPATRPEIRIITEMIQTMQFAKWELGPQVNSIYVDTDVLTNNNSSLKVFGFTSVFDKEI